VQAADVLKYDAEGRLMSVNLDIKNPSSLEVLQHRESRELIADIARKERRVLDLIAEIDALLSPEAA
jgi:type I restriction enzyme M protein